jgi:hypothetical protein
MNKLIYMASQARIDDLLRDAGDRRCANEVSRRLDVSASLMLRQLPHRLGRLVRVLRSPNSRPATRPSGMPRTAPQ